MSEYKHIKGGKELADFLRQFPAKVEANVMRSALRAGAKVVAEEVKRLCPVGDPRLTRTNGGEAGLHLGGALCDSVRVSASLKDGKVTASVKAGNKEAWYWRFVEFGTAAHDIAARNGGALKFAGGAYRSVQHPGARAKPFMRPALDSKAGEALSTIGEHIKKRLAKQGLNAGAIDIEVEAE